MAQASSPIIHNQSPRAVPWKRRLRHGALRYRSRTTCYQVSCVPTCGALWEPSAEAVLVPVQHGVDANSPDNGNGTALERRFATGTFRIRYSSSDPPCHLSIARMQISATAEAKPHYTRRREEDTLGFSARWLASMCGTGTALRPRKHRRKDIRMVYSWCWSMGQDVLTLQKTVFCI